MDKDTIIEECIFRLAMAARNATQDGDVSVVLEGVDALGMNALGDDTKEELQKMADYFGWPDCDVPNGLWCGKQIGVA